MASGDTPVMLAKAVAVQDKRLETLEKSVYGNGQPGIEKRLTDFVNKEIDAVKRHGNANMEEGDGLVLEAVKRETHERNRQHLENKEQHEKDKTELTFGLKDLGLKMETQGKELSSKVEAQGKILNRILTWGMVGFLTLITLRGLEDAGVIKIVGAQEAAHKIQSYAE